MKSIKYLITLIAILSYQLNAQSPYTGQNPIESGQHYIIQAGDSINVKSLKIQEGCILEIESGAILTGSGYLTVNGTLDVLSGGAVEYSGSIQFAFGNVNTARINLGRRAYISITGSLTQYNPSIGDAVINMAEGSIFEICGTFTQNKTSQSLVHYTSGTNRAYFITKASASGAGSSTLSDNERITWIAVGTVGSLVPGQASYCGPNATESTCDLWPQGLTTSYTSCNEAKDIIHYIILPIRLISFNAHKQGETAVLKWATASEQNNAGFYIEYSRDGISWQKIGFVNSRADNGLSSRNLNYSFSTENTSEGINYFRLRQVDIDGTESVSPIRSLIYRMDNKAVFLSPNPTQSSVKLQGLKGNESIEVYNTQGILVKQLTVHKTTSVTLDFMKLNSGVYFVKIISPAGKIGTHQIIKY